MKYFWTLDSQTGQDDVQGYLEALKGKKSFALMSKVKLLEAKIPTPPEAYITSAMNELLGSKPGNDFIRELGVLLNRMEKISKCQLGGKEKPLLISVHGELSGSIRNIGVSLGSLKAMIHNYGAETAFTLYVDFLESYSSLVLGCPHTDFRKTFGIEAAREGGAGGLVDLTEQDFIGKVQEYQNLVSQKIGRPFNDAPERQLLNTIVRICKIGKDMGGDEIFVSAQVHPAQFGQSVHGVAYTRDPFSGKKDLYGVYQEGGNSKKYMLEPTDSDGAERGGDTLREKQPVIFSSIKKYMPQIEAAFRDVMEVGFVTDPDGDVFFNHFDKANTTSRATVVSAIDLNVEGKISDREAAQRLKPKDIEVLLHPTLDEASKRALEDVGSKGVAAAPGTAVGHVFFKMKEAMDFYQNAVKNKGDKRVILIADELLISDTPGLGMITGLATKASGIASHAAVMARANGIPCIVGYKGLEFDHDGNAMVVGDRKIPAGTLITLEAGEEGKIYIGEGRLQNLSHQEGVIKDISLLVSRVLKQEGVPMQVRVNINNGKDAATGLAFGASGVGLCRTENMFMAAESLREVRNVIFTRDVTKCADSFKKLEDIQYKDYKKIFEVMEDRVVNIRLMDLPLHDFAPQNQAEIDEIARQLPHLDHATITMVAESLKEHNPMLGLRACRYGIIVPEMYNMQIRAIIRAAYDVSQTGTEVNPGIMFPLVFSKEELATCRERVLKIEQDILEELKIPFGKRLHVRVGCMVELPAACLRGDEIAQTAEFFAFGTNDLTQTTLGISRDDSAHYLPQYIEKGILKNDPAKVLLNPVRELIQIATKRGRRMREDLSVGICGEQGGDKTTLEFCLANELNYVSCSPFRVLPARVALLQVALAAAPAVTEEAQAA